jgi:hypothetical protein
VTIAPDARARALAYRRQQETFSTEAAEVISRMLMARLSWSVILARFAEYQLLAATVAVETMAEWAGRTRPNVDPTLFAGVTSYGYSIAEPLIATIDARVPAPVEAIPAPWWDVAEAADFVAQVRQLVDSEVMDAARSAAGAEMVTEPDWQNYVRVLVPPSCKRCVPLAGRIYRDLDGFERHPGCDCIHYPVESWEEAHDAGLVFSPREAFEKGFIRDLTKAERRAIEDGADITTVINSSSGMYTADVLGQRVKATTASTTKRARWRQQNPSAQVRLRPEGIYKLVDRKYDGDRDVALAMLEEHGYLSDAGKAARVEAKAIAEASTQGEALLTQAQIDEAGQRAGQAIARQTGGNRNAMRDLPALWESLSVAGPSRDMGDDGPGRSGGSETGDELRVPLSDLFSDRQAPGEPHESFAEGTWRAEMDGQFGRGGLRAELAFMTFWPDRFNVAGDIIGPDGRHVGGYDRTYFREADGTLWAEHDFLQITDKNLQGTGFANEFNAALYDWYRFSGLERVELTANIDVGGYTWARDGYEFAHESSALQTLERLRAETVNAGEDAAAVLNILDRATRFNFGDPEYPSAMEISQAGRMPHHRGRAATWPGKRAMIGLNKNWHGVLWL